MGTIAATSLHLTVRFSKTDRQGYGRLVAHQRQDGGTPCIVSEIEKFVAYTRDAWGIGKDHALFVWPDGSDFTADEMAGEMKSVAALLGCDATKVSAHSLRFGGASLLASFGLPQYIIEYFGGWAKDSKTLPLYAQPDSAALAIASGCFGRFRMGGEVGARLRDLGYSGYRGPCCWPAVSVGVHTPPLSSSSCVVYTPFVITGAKGNRLGVSICNFNLDRSPFPKVNYSLRRVNFGETKQYVLCNQTRT